MPKYKLGQRVSYTAHMSHRKGGMEGKWERISRPGSGIVVGKRNVSDGYTVYDGEDVGNIYTPTRCYSFRLVAHNLNRYHHVAEEDIESG